MSYKASLQANNNELRAILSDVNDLPVAEERSPFPIEVSTVTEMNAILSNATSNDIGAVYRYIGETTNAYQNGELYIIAEDS